MTVLHGHEPTSSAARVDEYRSQYREIATLLPQAAVAHDRDALVEVLVDRQDAIVAKVSATTAASTDLLRLQAEIYLDLVAQRNEAYLDDVETLGVRLARGILAIVPGNS